MSGSSLHLQQPFFPSLQAERQRNRCMEIQRHPWRISEAHQPAGFLQDLHRTQEAVLYEEEIQNQDRIPVLPADDRPSSYGHLSDRGCSQYQA